MIRKQLWNNLIIILLISDLTFTANRPLTFTVIKTSNENFLKYEGPVIEIKEIADDESHKAFSSLKSNKSPGYSDLSSGIFKAVSDKVSITTKYLFNISLQHGVFSDKLKIGSVKSSRREVLCKKRVLKISQISFLIKSQASGLQLY